MSAISLLSDSNHPISPVRQSSAPLPSSTGSRPSISLSRPSLVVSVILHLDSPADWLRLCSRAAGPTRHTSAPWQWQRLVYESCRIAARSSCGLGWRCSGGVSSGCNVRIGSEMKARRFCTPYRLSNIVLGILYCEDGTRFVQDRAMVLQCQAIYKPPRIP